MQDGQGSTRALTSSSNQGVVTDTYSYTAFGELFNSSGTTVNPYQYTGQQFDSLTGLYDLRARYYNPALGRFLSQDTYPVNFNNPVELNRYVYTGNDPINGFDPTGHDDETEYGGLVLFGTVIGVGVETALPEALFGAEVIVVEEAMVAASPSLLSVFIRIVLASTLLAPIFGPVIAPPAYAPPETKTEESQKSIVLDFGPGWNAYNSMVPLIEHFRQQKIKVVGIDNINAAALNVTLMQIYPAGSDLYHVIDGDYTNPNILASNGYDCASMAFAFWPDVRGENDLPIAARNLLCNGGTIYIVSEQKNRIKSLEGSLGGFMNVTVFDEPYSADCLSISTCSPIGIGVTSNEFSSDSNYILTATKR